MSTSKNNLYEKGFYASTYAQELKTDRNLRVLITTEDVTKEVNEATAKAGGDASTRQKVIRDIQRASSQASGLMCEVIVLYQGGQYHNYCYKTYDDVRLVFASEKNVWFMGGDADNFEYPRYTMDIAFFRAYENGKPAKTPEHFTWSKAGADVNELIFVSGHPGRTARLLTSEALKTERETEGPFPAGSFPPAGDDPPAVYASGQRTASSRRIRPFQLAEFSQAVRWKDPRSSGPESRFKQG